MHALLLLAFTAAPPAEPDDTHDLILLHPKRPYRLRLHLRDDGRSFLEGWSRQIARLFRHLDRDGDGQLSAAELVQAPAREQWLSITSGEGGIDPEPAPTLAEVAGGRRFATLSELEAYYATTTSGPLQMFYRQTTASDPASEELFRQLVPGGHPLTVARMKGAARLMDTFDTDDDETLSEGELLGGGLFYYRTPMPNRRGNAHGLGMFKLPFFSSRPDRREAGLPEALKATYKRSDPSWARPTPDVVLRVDVGLSMPPAVVRCPPGIAMQPTRGGVQLAIEDWLVHVGLDVYPSAAALREDARAQFRTLDRDSNGYIDKKEIYQPPFEHVAWLRLADRDADGVIMEAEWLGFAAVMNGLKGKLTVLRVQDDGPSLYRLLDVDGDGRLSRRELVEGHRNLGPGLAKGYHQVPHLYRVSVGRDQVRVRTTDETISPVRVYLPARGPLWFRKMDHNGDGDVSRREWLGTRETFDRIDADRDGLIGVEEAESYDRATRR